MALFSIIIPWSNRDELAQTLKENLPVFEKNAAEVIVVNCGGNLHQLRQLVQDVNYNIRSVSIENVDLFNKSLALNIGVSVSTGEYLFFLDTDILLQEDFLPEALVLLASGCFLTIEKVYESEKPNASPKSYLSELAYYISIRDINGNNAMIETSRHFINERSRSAPGLVLLSRENFLYVNGMNSALCGWGWEDNDLLSRLQLRLKLQWKRISSAIHLTHPNSLRALQKGSKQASETSNFSRCMDNYSQGNYSGTYIQDAENFKHAVMLR